MAIVFEFAQRLSKQELAPATPLWFQQITSGITLASFNEADAVEIRKRYPDAIELIPNAIERKMITNDDIDLRPRWQ